MKQLIFNSSMPRSCSTLLQNIFNQRLDSYATPTDGVFDLLINARQAFTNSSSFLASKNQDLMLKAWRNFCKSGITAYSETISDKDVIFLKDRNYKAHVDWLENFLGETPKMVCMVRNLKGIVASLEKLHRKNPDKSSQWYVQKELRGTTVEKRVDMYVQNLPLATSIDQMKDLIQKGWQEKILFVRAEDLCLDPKTIMAELDERLGLQKHFYDFNYVEQTTHENDVIHGLDINLHTIKNKVEPIQEDYLQILGEQSCQWIDDTYSWYQQFFGYIN
jgi:hypothetical protein